MGMDVDLAKALAAPMQREIRVELMDWNLAQEKVLKGEADGLLGMSITEERRKLYDFAISTFTREFGVLVRQGEVAIRSVGDLKGKEVGVTAGGFPRRFLESKSGVRLVLIHNYQDGLARLKAGSVDAVAADLWVAAYLMEQGGVRGITLAGAPFATAEAAIAVRKGNTALVGEINRALRTLESQGKLVAIQDDWRPKEMLFVSRERVRGMVAFGVTVLVLVVFAAMAAWIFTLKKQMRSRRLAESALRDSEARLRTLADASFEGIAVCEDGILVDANDQMVKLLGYGSRAEMVGKPVIELVAPESRELVRRTIESGRAEPYEHLAIRKDGTVFPVEVCGRTMARSPHHVRVTAVRDMTARKQAEDELRTLTERLKLAAATASIAVWDWNLRTNEAVWDERAFEIHGLPPRPGGRIVFQDWADRVHPEDLPGQLAALERTIAERKTGTREFRIIRPDGSVRHLQGAEVVILDKDGTPARVVGVNHDITERKQAESALRASEERYRNFIALAGEGIFRLEFDPPIPTSLPVAEQVQAIIERGIVAECNNAAARLRGWSTGQEMQGKRVSDLMRAADSENRLTLAGFVTAGHKAVDVVTRGRNAQGEDKFFLNNAVGFVQDGALRHLWSVQRDITRQREAEAALRASEESLRATIENTPHVAVQWYDARGRVVFWNPASELMFGWKAGEAVGRTLDQLIHTPEEAAAFVRVLAEIGQTGQGIGPVEYPFRRRDGTAGVCLSTTFRIPSANGQFSFVCMDVDLTERKQAELSLREAQERELRAREEFAGHLLTAQEEERRRIASELHDSLGQNLLLVKNRALLALATGTLPAAAREQVEAISLAASEAITEVRQISHDLHPYQLDQLGLKRALEVMIENTARATDIVLEHKLDAADDVFTPAAAANVYRVVQECLNNLLKHSQARRAFIGLERDVHEVRLWITDDGCGFAVDQPASGFGLRNIAERVRILKGSLKVISSPGQGTRLEVAVPIVDVA